MALRIPSCQICRARTQHCKDRNTTATQSNGSDLDRHMLLLTRFLWLCMMFCMLHFPWQPKLCLPAMLWTVYRIFFCCRQHPETLNVFHHCLTHAFHHCFTPLGQDCHVSPLMELSGKAARTEPTAIHTRSPKTFQMYSLKIHCVNISKSKQILIIFYPRPSLHKLFPLNEAPSEYRGP